MVGALACKRKHAAMFRVRFPTGRDRFPYPPTSLRAANPPTRS